MGQPATLPADFTNLKPVNLMNGSLEDKGGNSNCLPLCPHCRGRKEVMLKTTKEGITTEKMVTCPRCRGTGKAGLLTK